MVSPKIFFSVNFPISETVCLISSVYIMCRLVWLLCQIRPQVLYQFDQIVSVAPRSLTQNSFSLKPAENKVIIGLVRLLTVTAEVYFRPGAVAHIADRLCTGPAGQEQPASIQ